MKKELLHVQDMSKSLYGQEIFRHLSFDLFAGETLCVLIPPLAGKTTLVHILRGDESFTGSVFFNGKPVKASLKQFNGSGEILCLTRDTPLIPTLSIGENMFLRPHKRGISLIARNRDIESAQNSLDYLDLGISASRTVRESDLFTQHMALIANTLNQGLRMVVFDDPGVYYDREQMKAMARILALLRGHGVAVLWLTSMAFPLDMKLLDRLILVEDYRKTRTFFHPEEYLPAAEDAADESAEEGAFAAARTDDTSQALCMSSVTTPGLRKIDLRLSRGAAIGIEGRRQQYLQFFYNLFLPDAVENPVTGGSFIVGGALRRGEEVYADFGSGYVVLSDTFAHDQLLSEQSVLDNVYLPLSRSRNLPLLSFNDGFRKSLSQEIEDRLGIPKNRQGKPAGDLETRLAQELILLRIELQRPAFVLYFSPYSRLEQPMQERLEQAFRRFQNAGIGLLIATPGLERFRSLLTDRYTLHSA